MCGINKCVICGRTGEMCGQPCHDGICQMYVKIYAAYYHLDGRTRIFDNTIYMTASGCW